MGFTKFLAMSGKYYDKQIKEFGPTFKGVDWASPGGQKLRFDQLLRCCNVNDISTINDYGCGYGAFLDYLTAKGYNGFYHGYDISEQMIIAANKLHKDVSYRAVFTGDETLLTVADYSFASGIFNILNYKNYNEWTEYVKYTLAKIAELSKKGFTFNLLSNYLDVELRCDDLYYADPFLIFDYCKKNFSDHVVLLHDYLAGDFTISVKMEDNK